MKWFNRWLARRVEAGINDHNSMKSNLARPQAISVEESPDLQSSGMRFHLYSASGGTVIEVRQYDRKHDRNDHRLYVIPEGQDFHQSLTEIVTMERIKSPH